MTIPERIADARQKLAKATPLPWEKVGLTLRVSGRGVILRSPTPDNGGVFDCSPNISYAGVAVNGFPALAAEVERLGKALERIQRVACGEDQLEDEEALDDTETLGWIHRYIEAALAAGKPKEEEPNVVS